MPQERGYELAEHRGQQIASLFAFTEHVVLTNHILQALSV
jgi:hypothetical protein